MRRRSTWAFLLLASAAAFLPGLDWGLPSAERAALVLPPGQRTEARLREMAEARQSIYDRSRGNPRLELADKMVSKRPLYEETFRVPKELLPLAYSSFLIRSRDPDEQQALAALSRMKPRRLDLNPHYFVYGGFYLYPLGGWLAACRLLRAVRLVPDVSFYYKDPIEMRRIFLAGRAFTVLFGIAAVFCLYAAGRDLYGEAVGLAAAALAALTPAVLAQARLMKPHLPGALFAFLGVASLLRLLGPGGGSADWRRAGLGFGLAAGCNPLFGSLGGLALVLAQAMRTPWRSGAIAPALRERGLWEALALLAGLYLLTNPYAVLAFGEFREEITRFHFRLYQSGGPLDILRFWWHPMRAGLGLGLWLWALCALAVTLAWGRTGDRFLAAFVLVGSAAIGLRLGDKAAIPELVRYFLPGVLLLALLEARAVDLVSRRWGSRLLKPGLGALLATAAVPAFATWSGFVRDNPREAPDIQAGRWIHENLPEGTRIGILQAVPHVYSEPPFHFERYRLYSLGPLFQDPSFKTVEPLPEYAVWGAHYGTFPRGDPSPYEGFLEQLGYRKVRAFGEQGSRNLLTTASMPFFIYRRAP